MQEFRQEVIKTMKLSELIKEYRDKNKMTMQNFADKCGLSKGYVSMLENEFEPSYTEKRIIPSLKTFKKLAIGLDMDVNDLLSTVDSDIDLTDNDEDNHLETYDNIYRIEKKKFPLLGTIACGEPIFASEDRESYVMAGTDIQADFCLICKGDSMINARIHDGDIVFIKKQDIVDNGEIAAVIIENEATLKRFYYYKEANLLILKAENPKYKDLTYSSETLDQIRVLGKAVAFQSDVI